MVDVANIIVNNSGTVPGFSELTVWLGEDRQLNEKL